MSGSDEEQNSFTENAVAGTSSATNKQVRFTLPPPYVATENEHEDEEANQSLNDTEPPKDNGNQNISNAAVNTSCVPRHMAAHYFEIPTRSCMGDELLEELFFTKQEYNTSRSAAKVIAREAARYGFSKNLQDTFGKILDENHRSKRSPSKTDRTASGDDGDPTPTKEEQKREKAIQHQKQKAAIQEKLNLWCAHGHTRRGLERWAHKEHGDARQTEQFQAIMDVLRAQDEMMVKAKLTNRIKPQGSCAEWLDDEVLRKISHKATRAARHFARMMGKADRYAVEYDELKDGSQTVVTEMSTLSHNSSNAIQAESSERGHEDDLISDTHHQRDKLGKRFRNRFGFGRKKEVQVDGESRIA